MNSNKYSIHEFYFRLLCEKKNRIPYAFGIDWIFLNQRMNIYNIYTEWLDTNKLQRDWAVDRVRENVDRHENGFLLVLIIKSMITSHEQSNRIFVFLIKYTLVFTCEYAVENCTNATIWQLTLLDVNETSVQLGACTGWPIIAWIKLLLLTPLIITTICYYYL